MNIIILGAGQVGSTVAYSLAGERYAITVVDLRHDLLVELQNHLDIRTVVGHASSPRVLSAAGAGDADMILAVTNSDETNMVACQVAHSLFHIPTKIARVRSPDYLAFRDLFNADSIPIDVLISPEQVVTEYLERLVEFPSALQIDDFANGRVQLVGLRADADGPLAGREVSTLARHIPNVETRVAAIFRHDRGIVPTGDTVIEGGDEVFFISARRHIRTVAREFRKLERPNRRVMIAGGGNIGGALAARLESEMHVKVIERNVDRARALAERLDRAVVLQGDGTDKGLLVEEDIDDTDVFCALTNDDEDNIMAALLAKRHGARRVVALVNRRDYVELMEGRDIDIVVSPQQVTIGAILPHVRRADMVAVRPLRRGAAEAIETVVHGDSKTSRVVGRTVDQISLPPGTTIGAVVRGEEVIIAHHDTIIQADDHLIMFVMNRQDVAVLERLFQVDPKFL